MAGFGLFADGEEKPTTHNAHLANEAVEQPETETSQHCWARTPVPVAGIDQTLERNGNVQL